MTTQQFQVGQTYYGSLACAHGYFPVTCVKRTEKSVWLIHATMPEHYPLRRCKVRDCGRYEGATFGNWYVTADESDSSTDMQLA